MCTTCGCSDTNQVTYTDPQTGETLAIPRSMGGAGTAGAGDIRYRAIAKAQAPMHRHAHSNTHGHKHLHAAADAHAHAHAHVQAAGHSDAHDHAHPHPGEAARAETLQVHRPGTTIALEQEILAKNQRLAERNRGWLAGRDILAINLMSSPGAGKTTLLERTIRDLGDELPIQVIEGDQATINDAERIRATGAKVIQINTGTGCHLEADMLERALNQLDPPSGAVVMIENVGNLVCPALFDLGERAKVVILSVTEGEDKPIKYPHMFRAADIMLLNKVDLLPYLKFDVERCIAYANEVNPAIRVFRVSATSGEGMDAWYGWLRAQAAIPDEVATAT